MTLSEENISLKVIGRVCKMQTRRHGCIIVGDFRWQGGAQGSLLKGVSRMSGGDNGLFLKVSKDVDRGEYRKKKIQG